MRWRAPISFSSCRKDKWLGDGTSFVFHCAHCVQPIRQRLEPLKHSNTKRRQRLDCSRSCARGKTSLNKASFEPLLRKTFSSGLSAFCNNYCSVCFFSSAHYRPLALVPAQAMPSSRFERFQHKHHTYLQAFVRPLSGWGQASLPWPGHRD